MKRQFAVAITVTTLLMSSSPWAAGSKENIDNLSEPARIRFQDMQVLDEILEVYDIEIDTADTARQILAESNKDIQDTITVNRPW